MAEPEITSSACPASWRRCRTGPACGQELPGHRDVGTTMAYTHVLDCGGRGVRSPLD